MILLKEVRITILLFQREKEKSCSLLTLNIVRALLNENLFHSFESCLDIWNS